MHAESSTSLVFCEHSPGHETGSHPENQSRLDAIQQHLKREGLLDDRSVYAAEHPDLATIARIHPTDLIESTRLLAERGGGYIDGDTIVTAGSFEAALGAVGAAVLATECVLSGRHVRAFSLARPPGHHAERSRQMGFCLFNNIAVAAQHALDEFGIERIAIVDWDVHHGNGTQDVFYETANVLFCSVHQWPLFPGSGLEDERGSGPGFGYTINVPLPAGSDEKRYLDVFDTRFLPAIEPLRPDLLMVSAGFDAHHDDPLAMMELSERSFASLAGRVNDWARTLCEGRLVLTLEGGYNLKSLSHSVAAVIRALDSEAEL